MVVLAYNFILALGIVYLLLAWALGSSIKDLCAATSKNEARKCSIIVGSRHCSYVYEKLLPPFTLLLRMKLRSFYFSEFHDCSLAYSGKDLYALTKSTQHLSQSFGYLLYMVKCQLPPTRSWRWSSLYARPAQTIRL